jgi:cobalt-zinc-cadmium efflux system protein
MGHDHHHHSHDTIPDVSVAFTVGIVLNFAFVIVEAAVGFSIHSLSLLSDAGHNLADVGTLGLSLLAFKLLSVKANSKFTYGYRKTSVLVALFNSVVLLVTIGGIFFEAFHRLFNPEPMPGVTIALVAGIGIVVNGTSALLFFRNRKNDLNIKSAYLHLLSDAVVSAGIVLGGISIFYTGWFWIDSAISVIVAIIILFSTWRILKDSLRLSLDGVPGNIQLNEIRDIALRVAGVKDLHHIHIWALSTTENALTAHLVVQKDATPEQEQQIKHELRHQLEHQHIHHITLETERENEPCEATIC